MIISLSGRAGSGKDTAADYLVSNYGFKKLSWAKNIKEMCKKAFNLSEEQVNTQAGKQFVHAKSFVLDINKLLFLTNWVEKTHKSKVKLQTIDSVCRGLLNKEMYTVRELLQIVGTEFCRGLYENYHIDIVQEELKKGGDFVIADSRFPNEVEAIDQLGGITIKIERPGNNIEQSSHASEALIDSLKTDYVYKNEDTIAEMNYFLDDVVFQNLDKENQQFFVDIEYNLPASYICNLLVEKDRNWVEEYLTELTFLDQTAQWHRLKIEMEKESKILGNMLDHEIANYLCNHENANQEFLKKKLKYIWFKTRTEI